VAASLWSPFFENLPFQIQEAASREILYFAQIGSSTPAGILEDTPKLAAVAGVLRAGAKALLAGSLASSPPWMLLRNASHTSFRPCSVSLGLFHGLRERALLSDL
jgi:hypothetical protein